MSSIIDIISEMVKSQHTTSPLRDAIAIVKQLMPLFTASKLPKSVQVLPTKMERADSMYCPLRH